MIVAGKPTKAVLYLRFSSENQREESIEGQRRENTEFCQRKGIEIVGEYVDRAKSATTDARPEFQRMIQESGMGLFDTVVVWKFDRFARNRLDSLTYKEVLRNNGIHLLSATEGMLEGPDSILMESVIDGVSEFYSADLSQKVKRGLTENVMKGKSIGGRPPLGYKIVDGKYEIDEKEGPIVKEIFRLYVDEHRSMLSIARHLKEVGMTRSDGAIIDHHIVENAILNERYTGVLRCEGTENPHGFPRLIDQGVFQKAGDRRHIRKHVGGAFRSEVGYALSGRVFCGSCGALLIGHSGTSKNGVLHSYYKCDNAINHKNCKLKSIRKETLEWAVCLGLIRILQDQKMMDSIVDTLFAQQTKESPELRAKKTRLKQVEKAIVNFNRAIGMGIITESTKTSLLNLEAEQKELKGSMIKAEYAEMGHTRTQVAQALRMIGSFKLDAEKARQILIETFVEKVVVQANHNIDVFVSIFGQKTTFSIRNRKGMPRVRMVTDMPCQPRSLRAAKTALFFWQGGRNLLSSRKAI
jgi:DNA invertase Pin-like site-specific DNA recombinase